MGKARHRLVQHAARPQVILLPPLDSQTAKALTDFAAGLNRLEQIRQQAGPAETVSLPTRERLAWEQAEAMLDELHEEEGNGVKGRRHRLAAFARRFTVAASGATLRMEIRSLGTPPVLQPVVLPLGPAAHVFALLWCAVVPDRAWTRLRRCRRPRCEAWFADHSDSQTKRSCGPACRTRWWNRDRRRQAGHTSQRPTSKTGKRIRALLKRAD